MGFICYFKERKNDKKETKGYFMRQFISTLLLIVAIVSSGFAQDQKRDPKKTAEFFAKSYLNKDYKTCIKMMDPIIVEDLGGETVVIAQFEKYRNALGDNMTIKDIEIGSADKQVARIQDEEYAIVPYLMIISDADGEELYCEGYYLATSRVNFPFWFIQNGGPTVENALKRYSEDLYNELNPPQVKMYNKDKSFLMIQVDGEWVPSEKTYEMMKELLENAEAE